MTTTPFRILLIEDDEKLARTIERRMQLESFDVIIKTTNSSTIIEDISIITEILRDERIDLIILDYVFDPSPAMSTAVTSGLAVLKAVREINKYVPVIIFTGYPTDIDQVELTKQGANYIVIKGDDNAIVEATRKFLIERNGIILDLEEIVKDNPKAEEPLLQGGDKLYSLKDVLIEIKSGSPKGRELYRLYKSGLSEIMMKLKKEQKQ